jgi:hypothetical protein
MIALRKRVKALTPKLLIPGTANCGARHQTKTPIRNGLTASGRCGRQAKKRHVSSFPLRHSGDFRIYALYVRQKCHKGGQLNSFWKGEHKDC